MVAKAEDIQFLRQRLFARETRGRPGHRQPGTKQLSLGEIEKGLANFRVVDLHDVLAQRRQFRRGARQHQGAFRAQAFDQCAEHVALADAGITLHVQVFVEVGTEGSQQFVLRRT